MVPRIDLCCQFCGHEWEDDCPPEGVAPGPCPDCKSTKVVVVDPGKKFDELSKARKRKEKKTLLGSMSKPLSKGESVDDKQKEADNATSKKKKSPKTREAGEETGLRGGVEAKKGAEETSAEEAKPVTEEKIQHRVTFALSEEDFAEKGKQVAALNSEISKLNYEFDGAKRTHKAAVALREEEIEQLLTTIRRGKEDREVECVKSYDYEHGIVRFFHAGKVVEERAMDAYEKQMKAF